MIVHMRHAYGAEAVLLTSFLKVSAKQMAATPLLSLSACTIKRTCTMTGQLN